MDENTQTPVQTEKARDVDFRDIKISNQRSNLIPIVIGIVIVLALIAGYFLVIKKPEPNKTTPSKTEVKKSTTSAKIASNKCGGNQFLSNTKQGYEICFPQGWVQKELKASGLIIGLDPKQVDEKSKGTISVSVKDQSEAQVVQDISNNTSKFEFGPVNVDGVKGTQVTYTRLKSDDLATTYPRGIDTVISKFERRYKISLISNDADFETNKTIYETFLTDFKFIKNTSNPPWSESRNILVDSPWSGDSIKNPVEISGEAIAFEGTVNIRVKDSDNHVLSQTTTQNQSGTERSAFKISLDFNKPTTKKGTIEVYTLSAKDGEEQDKVTITVIFQ